MPKFQQLAEKFRKNSEVAFYAVNIFRDTTEIAWVQKFLETKNIKIPLLFICANDEKYIQNFNFRAFPQYNIVRNGTIIFDGCLEILDSFERKYLK